MTNSATQAQPTWTSLRLTVGEHEIAVLQTSQRQDGPVLVFVHGITSSVHLWPPLLPSEITSRYHCVSLSLPGHAPSRAPEDFHRNDVANDLFVAVLKSLLRELPDQQRVHLIGWSTGGFQVLLSAAHLSSRIASVISLSGFARGRWHGLLGLLQGAAARIPNSGVFELLWKLMCRHQTAFALIIAQMNDGLMGRAGHYRNHAVIQDMFLTFRSHERRVMQTLMAGVFELDTSDKLKSITCPTLLIGGEKDRTIVPDELRHLSNLVPTSQTETIPKMGHLFFVRHNDAVMRLIRQWVDQQEAEDSASRHPQQPSNLNRSEPGTAASRLASDKP